MAKIIWIGTPFFGPWLKDAGHEVAMVDFPAPGRCHTWADLLRLSGFERPDAVVATDRSSPPYLLGVESFPCLTVFYVIDSHIHSWYPFYAQAFDLCLISLKDDIAKFSGKRLPASRLIWSPVFTPQVQVERETASLPEKQWDLLFVGKVDPAVNPERAEFLTALARLFPALHWQSGNFGELYPKARLVLNHSIAGDLNFRVMESLGLGVCLLTPKIGNGQDELFTDGHELFMFDQSDPSGLVNLVRRLLLNPELCAETATRGLEKVRGEHQGIHRAKMLSKAILELFAGERAEKIVAGRLEQSDALHKTYLKYIYLLHAESAESESLRAAYLAAALKSA